MKLIWPPQDQSFWYLQRGPTKPLRTDMSTQIVIVGGGMAGLSAAQSFAAMGKQVVLLEQYYCGSGASGKSSGFITPNAELSLHDFDRRYGKDVAKRIWDLITGGVEKIRSNIFTYNLDCDYQPQDTIVVANDRKSLQALKDENKDLEKLGYKSAYYDENTIKNYVGSSGYYGGVGYEDTFGIDGYKYCQEMKRRLEQQGVQIYEETPVIQVNDKQVKTAHATVTADHIIVCVDRFLPDLGLLNKEIYHAQTFLMVSQVLAPEQLKTIFPEKNYMVWDTEFIYNYYRVTGQGRLLLGGGSVFNTFDKNESYHNQYMYRKLTKYFAKKFPSLSIQFEQYWPGLIGLSKDIGPIAGQDKDKKSIYYISAAAGLPIAAGMGTYAAEHIVQGRADLDPYLSPYRSYFIGRGLQTIVGTKIAFGLSNLKAHYFP